MIPSDYLLGPKSRASPKVHQPHSYNIIFPIQEGLITDILTSEILPLSYHPVKGCRVYPFQSGGLLQGRGYYYCLVGYWDRKFSFSCQNQVDEKPKCS